jgi:hypothetical protein
MACLAWSTQVNCWTGLRWNSEVTLAFCSLLLIEMFDALLSLAPGLSAKQKHKQSGIMATALIRLERKDA